MIWSWSMDMLSCTQKRAFQSSKYTSLTCVFYSLIQSAQQDHSHVLLVEKIQEQMRAIFAWLGCKLFCCPMHKGWVLCMHIWFDNTLIYTTIGVPMLMMIAKGKKTVRIIWLIYGCKNNHDMLTCKSKKSITLIIWSLSFDASFAWPRAKSSHLIWHLIFGSWYAIHIHNDK